MNDRPLRRYAEAFCQRGDADWVLIKEIGRGNSASVYKVTSGNGDAALKIYHPRFFAEDKGEVERRRVLDQMKLKGHGHPNLVDFFDAGPLEDTYFLLMEFFPWPSLDRRLPTMERRQIAEVVSKIAAAAEFLEQRGFVHRDIKPANVVVSDDCEIVKLLDLGVMRTISANNSAPGTDAGYALPFVATAQYSSPAYLFRDDSATEDMWKALTFYQLGAVLHDLLMKRPLFDSEVRTLNKYRVAAAVLLKPPEVHALDVPPWLVTLARNCLVKDDDLRLARVRWASFHAGRRSRVPELRAKLGLQQPSPTTRVRASANHTQERLRVRLDASREFLINLCRHVLVTEGFPQAGMTHESQPLLREIRFCFRPRSATTGSSMEVCFVLRLSVRDQSHEHVDVFLASLLRRQGASRHCVGALIWTTTLEDLATEGEQLGVLLTEEFIKRYAAADDRVVAFDGQEDSTVEVTQDEEQDG